MEDARDLWGHDGWGRRGTEMELDLSPFHDVRAIGVEGAGHWVHHDQFEVFMDHIESFLSDEREDSP